MNISVQIVLSGYSRGSLNRGRTRGTKRHQVESHLHLHKAAALSTAQAVKDTRQHAGVGSDSFNGREEGKASNLDRNPISIGRRIVTRQ